MAPDWVCITLQIGRVVGMTDFGTFMCSPCHYCPLLLFLCGLWLVAWHSASSSVGAACPISWFRHCCFNDSLFFMRSPSEYIFFTCFLISFFFFTLSLCICTQHLGSLVNFHVYTMAQYALSDHKIGYIGVENYATTNYGPKMTNRVEQTSIYSNTTWDFSTLYRVIFPLSLRV